MGVRGPPTEFATGRRRSGSLETRAKLAKTQIATYAHCSLPPGAYRELKRIGAYGRYRGGRYRRCRSIRDIQVTKLAVLKQSIIVRV